jgi:hypothetical protein
MEANYKHWTNELNGATQNWQKNRMWYGATNDSIKIVHVNDGAKLCTIEVAKNFSNEKLKGLFKELFGIELISNSISYRG